MKASTCARKDKGKNGTKEPSYLEDKIISLAKMLPLLSGASAIPDLVNQAAKPLHLTSEILILGRIKRQVKGYMRV